MGRKRRYRIAVMLLMSLLAITFIDSERVEAQPTVVPTLVDPRLDVRTVVSGLNMPTTMAFLGDDDILVLEKETGRVRRVINGAITSTVLDLAVNFGSERGLLGIALHPKFPTNPGVYLFWTESTTGNDTSVLSETPLLGNRVDRFTWDGSTLTLDQNIIMLRAIQQDATNPVERGNHDGGMLRFGPDGKLYIFFGDQGRRGQLQNLPDGPFGPGQPDDQFGGPEPDDAHLSGVVLRLNDDGTAPGDNPFFNFGASVGGEVGANIQKIFSYGHRNSFGMAFDPFSGKLWLQENGDDTFTELNLVEAGMNGGWVQIAGPVERIAQFKQIETSTAIDPIKMSVLFRVAAGTLVARPDRRHARKKRYRDCSCSLAHITVIQNLAGSSRWRRRVLDSWIASLWDRDTRETFSSARRERSWTRATCSASGSIEPEEKSP